MVGRVLAKDELGVRFSLPAQKVETRDRRLETGDLYRPVGIGN